MIVPCSAILRQASDPAGVGTHLQVVEGVELHQVVESGEGLVGVLEVESGERRLGVVEDVKVGEFPFLVILPGNPCVIKVRQ